jgi:hypothetical protein
MVSLEYLKNSSNYFISLSHIIILVLKNRFTHWYPFWVSGMYHLQLSIPLPTFGWENTSSVCDIILAAIGISTYHLCHWL